jgi:hypothetical protein
MREFRLEGPDKTGLVDRLRAHMAVEIAIGAFGKTKRPMHIDPEAWAGGDVGLQS